MEPTTLVISSSKEERKAAYEEYLASDHWRFLKGKLLTRCACRCEACHESGRPIDGHHLIYRDPLTRCTVDDLMGLCRRCHDLVHILVAPFSPAVSPRDRFRRTRGTIRSYLGLKPVKADKRPKRPSKEQLRQARWATQVREIQRRNLRREWSF